jgi:HSP20 family protein
VLAGLPPSLTALHPGHLIKLEDEMEDGHYVLRAELQGIDPDKDVDITVRDGRLPSRPSAASGKKPKVGQNSPTARLLAR